GRAGAIRSGGPFLSRVGRFGMTFGPVLRDMLLGRGSRFLLTRLVVASHLHNDLNAAFVGHPVGQQLAHGCRERVFSHVRKWQNVFSRRGGARPGSLVVRRRSPQGRAWGFGDGLVVALPVFKPVTDMSN